MKFEYREDEQQGYSGFTYSFDGKEVFIPTWTDGINQQYGMQSRLEKFFRDIYEV